MACITMHRLGALNPGPRKGTSTQSTRNLGDNARAHVRALRRRKRSLLRPYAQASAQCTPRAENLRRHEHQVGSNSHALAQHPLPKYRGHFVLVPTREYRTNCD
eukprot:scaffold177097_cov27-Tisochrysis_lutea.AAC.3